MDSTAAFNAGIPAFGTMVLYAFLVTAAAAFGLSVAAATAHPGASPRYLRAARMAALGTCALVALDVLLLLYAFVSHDFRIRYVQRYSDRTMPEIYLIASLWGGQDGSLLWWTFLLSLYSGACVVWLRNKHHALAPYVIATLMSIVMFFGVLMAFAANPFSASVAGAPVDGEGLNPSLQNYWMAIHPPSLYSGFVGCSVPFAFVIAALVSGKLDEEWIRATRKWALFAWMFLSIGNVLGMKWAYEELGWGGFWAWDPVENAACLPWFTCTAYLHSVMIQERRGSLKIWNVTLLMTTFLLTIFGTFLTRSGLISSIHSFAQSEVGIYFVWYMAFLIAVCVALVALRYPQLRKRTEIDALLSREAMFVANNWLLLGISLFIAIATTWPKISEWLWSERLTVGASFYNAWVSLPGTIILALMAIGTLTPWRKASPKLLWQAFQWPLVVGALFGTLHAVFGGRIGMPGYVALDPIYPSTVGRALAVLNGAMAPVRIGLVAFNIAALVQEFYRGAKARERARGEGMFIALVRLVVKNRRRYGGYVVHLGIVVMVLGWTGAVWRTENEASLRPGESFSVGRYTLRYDNVQSVRKPDRREINAHVTVTRDGQPFANIVPAKYIYTSHPDSPTSEVSITSGLRDDLYVVMASVNPTTRIAHLKAFVNPLTAWIWIGAMILVMGCVVGLFPELSFVWARGFIPADPSGGGDGGGGGGGGTRDEGALSPQGAPSAARAGQGALLLLALSLGLGVLAYANRGHAQGHTMSQPPPVGGDSEALTPGERHLFDQMLCMCGDCQRLPLASCTCDFAAATRNTMREKLRRGMSPDQIIREYAARYGSAALSVPPDAGHNRAVYAIPIVALAGGAGLAVWIVRRWRAQRDAVVADAGPTARAAGNARVGSRDEYDRQLDEELRGLDD